MTDLFKNRDADFCSLVEYVNTFLNTKNEYFNIFQLPPIQRNSVWNVAQIERIWDSILRGFPIGSFLIADRKKGRSAREIYSGIQSSSSNDGYFLLDGQQRTRAILLGFKPNLSARLWIDLNPKLIFDNPEFNDRKFLIRAITTYQPWGMNDGNPQDKLYSNEKYQARKELGIESLHYDYQVEIDNESNKDLAKKFSWPIKASLPVPLDKLIGLCGGYSGNFIIPDWSEICSLIPERYYLSLPGEPTEYYKTILISLKNLLQTNSGEVKTRNIVLLLQTEGITGISDKEKDPMEVLFVRVNSSGTVLGGEEMAYSLLKSSWDGAYEMVSTIIGSPSIGYLLPSTGIVMAATRMARFIMDEKDDPSPGVSNFRRWIGTQSVEKGFIATMKELLISNNDNKSVFNKTLETFCSLVIFDEKETEDIGLPKKLLLSIKPVLLHPVFIWININLENIELLKNSRINILRYLIYSFITIDNTSIANKASKEAVSVIRDNRNELFPDSLIYRRLSEELTAPLPTVALFSRPFITEADGFLRHWGDVFKNKMEDGIVEEESNAFRWCFWQKKGLLLWFQRAYAAKWFVGYNPMSDDNYDTPYDWDHILPRSHLIGQGGYLNIYSKDERKAIFGHDWNRNYYINSIGNFRLWPLWGNRSDNNICHTQKLRMDLIDLSSDNTAKELGLKSSEDFLKASSINIADKDLWYNAGGNVKDWPELRRIAWQVAVERRVCYLYKELFDKFKFNLYTNNN